MTVSPHPGRITYWDTHLSTSAELGPRACPDDSPQQTTFQPQNRDEARLPSQTRQREPQPDSHDRYAGMAESKNWILYSSALAE